MMEKKDNRQQEKTHLVSPFLFLQFLFSFFVVSYVVDNLAAGYGMPISVFIGCSIGMLLTMNLSQGIFALQVVLDRLVHGLPVQQSSWHRYWPLHTHFLLVSRLEERQGQQVQIERQTVAYKDQLLEQVIKTTAQEERNRLARDLHDSIKQQIFSITMSAAAARARWEQDRQSVQKILDDIERTAHEAQVEMQAMLQQLRPEALENTGLIESLRLQSQSLEYRTGAKVIVEIGSLPSENLLPPGSQEMLFRIVQEGFSNIVRHARASQIWLSLYQQEDFLLLEIGDNGQGFVLADIPNHSNAGGMGMKNIHERVEALNGIVQIWSMPDQGTTLHVALPLLVQPELALIEKQTEADFIPTIKRAQLILHSGLRIIDGAAACILLYLPGLITRFLLGICLCAGFIIWVIAQNSRAGISFSIGRNHPQYRSLVLLNDKLLIGLLTLSIFYLGYLYNHWLSGWWTFIILTLLLILIIHYCIERRQYCRMLTHHELYRLITAQQQQVGLDFLVWSLTTGFATFFGIITPDMLTLRFIPTQWIQNAGVSLCLLWLIITLLKGGETLYWRWQLVRRNMGDAKQN